MILLGPVLTTGDEGEKERRGISSLPVPPHNSQEAGLALLHPQGQVIYNSHMQGQVRCRACSPDCCSS